MGKRGPAPKANAARALEGNPGNRRVVAQVDEDDLSSGSLRMATRLTEEERRVWADTLAAFPSWYFTAADKYQLIAYCRAVARMERSEKALQKTSTVEKRANGSPCLNPHVAVINAALSQVMALSDALGISRKHRRGAIPQPPPEGVTPAGDGPEFPAGLLAPALTEPTVSSGSSSA